MVNGTVSVLVLVTLTVPVVMAVPVPATVTVVAPATKCDPVSVMVGLEDGWPVGGLMLVSVGVPKIVNVTALLVPPAVVETVTLRGPVAAPALTVSVALMDVDVTAPRLTVISFGGSTATVVAPGMKLVPASVTSTGLPTKPSDGVIVARVGVLSGSPDGGYGKAFDVCPATVTLTFPAMAVAGI